MEVQVIVVKERQKTMGDFMKLKDKLKKRKQKSVMFDEDKLERLEKLTQTGGHGARSDLINAALAHYLGEQSNTRTLAFINNKGGVGKTTSTCNVAYHLASLGKKTLLIDLDPQGNSSGSFGYHDLNKPSLVELFKGEMDVEEILINVKENLDLLPSNDNLNKVKTDPDLPGLPTLLKNRLTTFNTADYDYIVIDCAPGKDDLNVNALAIADSVYIPIEGGIDAYNAVGDLIHLVEKCKKNFLNHGLEVKGVFTTKFDGRRNIDITVKELAAKKLGDLYMKTLIRYNTAIGDSRVYNKCVMEYDPKSNGAQDYAALTKEILMREGDEA